MSKVAVIYWSGTGNTEAMAQAVAEGAKAAGAETDLLTCAEVTGVEAYDAVALGCPAMGAEELEDGEFLPMLEGIEPSLPGKKVVSLLLSLLDKLIFTESALPLNGETLTSLRFSQHYRRGLFKTLEDGSQKSSFELKLTSNLK